MHKKLLDILEKEKQRQINTINLIPSENYTSKAVREAVGSVFMHKYSEGNIGNRYYEGNEFIDELESLAIEMIKKVFELPINWSANVQALAGSNANLIVYNSILEPGDKILSLYLPDGGHLSHGWSISSDKNEIDSQVYYGGEKKVSIVSKFYNVVQYKTNKETNLIDYDFVSELAKKEKPKLIITGGTAYPRNIDYKKFSEISKHVNALYLADVAHEAGLIAGKALPSPIGIADFVTFTTHKTLRGPKGAVIVSTEENIKKVNKSVMPGIQGGPHNGTIAGITQALFEADTEEFKEYAKQVIKNAKIFEEELKKRNFKLVTDGTDKHLVLIDLRNKNINGKYYSKALAKANIITNMNTIPYETGTPANPSGLRIGTPSITTRKMGLETIKKIVEYMNETLNISIRYTNRDIKDFENEIKNNNTIQKIKKEIQEICQKHPIEI